VLARAIEGGIRLADGAGARAADQPLVHAD